jgi:DNA-binding CsgD family transcriptional regulator
VADLVEACVRAHLPVPDSALAVMAHSPPAAPAMRGLIQRCRGLVAAENEFEACLGDALEAYDEAGMPFARARTALVLGERLRRAGRRVESRAHLRAALAVFSQLDASPWADRAELELRATGETVQRRGAEAREGLTAQELQVALVVAHGATNREAGARLFLSPKTIEYHLGRVYRKLGVRSRTELAHQLPDSEQPHVATPALLRVP